MPAHKWVLLLQAHAHDVCVADNACRGHNYDVVLPEMLAAGVRVMIYAGDQVGLLGCAAAATANAALQQVQLLSSRLP